MTTLPQNIAKTPWLATLLILLFAFSVYSPILQGPFKLIYDSQSIVGNSLLRSTENVPAILTQTLFNEGVSYRPVTVLSHFVEYSFFSLTPFFYFLISILIHMSCAFLVYVLVWLLTKEPMWGFVTAILFAVHPTPGNVVALLGGRADLLNTFFNLAALTACVLYMRHLNGWWMLVSTVCFSLALLSQESCGYMVWVIFFYLVCVTTDEQSKGIRWLIVLLYATVGFLFMGLRHGLTGLRWDGIAEQSDIFLRVLSAVKSLLMEIGMLIVPIDIHWNQTIPSLQGQEDPQVFITMGFLMTALAVLWFLRNKVTGLTLFLSVWFLTALWPLFKVSYLSGIDGHRLPMNGGYVYMASIPFIVLLVMSIQKMVELSRPRMSWIQPLVLGAAIALIMAFFVLSYRHSILSTNEFAMLQETQRREPPSAVTEYTLGLIAMDLNQFDSAKTHFERAFILNPNMISARMALGKALYNEGKFLEAVKIYESIQNPGRYEELLENNLRSTYKVLALNQEALLRQNPKDLNVSFNLGIFYAKLGETGRAIAAYQTIIDLDPHNEAGLTRMALQFQGMIYQQLGNGAKAEENFERARVR